MERGGEAARGGVEIGAAERRGLGRGMRVGRVV